MQVKSRNQTEEHVEWPLWEFIWRRINKTTLWRAFISVLTDVHDK